MPNPELIAQALSNLTVHYGLGKSQAELMILAQNWEEDLRSLSDRDFTDAVLYWRRNQEKFPTSAGILRAHKEASEQPRPADERGSISQFAGMDEDENLERAKAGCRKILDGLKLRKETDGQE